MTTQPPHIVIAGGGVAAIEAVAALRSLAGLRPRITVLTPTLELPPRPDAVAAPFGFGVPSALPYDVVQRKAPFDVHAGTLARVQPGARRVFDDAGRVVEYDALLLAVGAKPLPSVPGVITFAGPDDAAAVERVLDETARIAFVVPPGSSWALPVYELAIMAATELRNRGREPEITVVTPEVAPLAAFGAEAGAAITALLAERGIALRTSTRAVAAADGVLAVEAVACGGEAGRGEARGAVLADRVVALPRLTGPAIVGLPQDRDGFLPVDEHARVRGVENVYAAGDATTFVLKQGGLATQQSDAAAETIAADLGAAVRPNPFRPVLRGLLLTGGEPLYLRVRLTPDGEPLDAADVSRRPLWSPPGKVAGRYLAPLLATARPPGLVTGALQDLVKTG
jgi:sulfide:quinone oxidoreductase